MKTRTVMLIIFFHLFLSVSAQWDHQIALLKYRGGGDWYANPTSLPNLIDFCRTQLGMSINPEPATVEPDSPLIFSFPLVHMTGHGNVVFNAAEAENLRKYLIGGGFLHIDDNYGLDQFVRTEMKKVFPELSFIEIPKDHEIYHQQFDFADGLPKIHLHDNKPSQGFGLFYEGRLVCYYSYESDLGDGWEDARIHNDSEETRLKALKMGANIVSFVFGQ